MQSQCKITAKSWKKVSNLYPFSVKQEKETLDLLGKKGPILYNDICRDLKGKGKSF